MARNSRVRVYFDGDTRGLTKATGQAENQLKKFQKAGSQSAAALGSVSKRAVGVAAGFVGIATGAAGLKQAADYTKTLALGTARLSSLTGMATTESSRWVELAKVRNVEAKALNVSFITLSKNLQAATDGGDKQIKMFERLGVSQQQIKDGKLGPILLELSDAFKRMGPGAERTALAQRLFGRQAQTMIPLLSKGSKALREQLALSDKYGTTLSEKQVKSALDAAAAQREMNIAVDGLKVAFGTVALPVLTKGTLAVGAFFTALRDGRGLPGKIARSLKTAFGEIGQVFDAGKKGFEGEQQMLGPFKLPDNRSFVKKLADGIAGAMAAIDWGNVLDVSSHISKGISAAFGNIDSQAAAEQLTLILLKTFNTALDPAFWMKHLDDVIIAALTFSKVGFLRKIPLLGPILGKLGDFLWKGIGLIFKGLGKLFGKLLWEVIEKAFSWLMRTAPKTAWKLGDFLGDVAVLGWRAVTSRFLALGSKIATAIGNGIVRAAGATGRAALNLLSKVWDAIRSTNVGRFGTWIASKIRDGVASLWKRFYSLGGFLLKKLKDGLINAPLNGLKSLGAKIGNAIQSGIGKVKAFVGIGGGIPLAGQLGHEKGGFGRVTALARGFGTFTGGPGQGYRPGDPGWHGKNRARDYSGGNMLGFAKAVASRFGSGLLELIHTPLGFGIKNGRRVPNSFFGSAVMADHYDHVHVAMRRGGKAGPGQGGPSVIYGEGKKTEWWISQEGDREQNTAWALEALEAVGGISLHKKGGKSKKERAAERKRRAAARREAKRERAEAELDADLAGAEMTDGHDDDVVVLNRRIKRNKLQLSRLERMAKKRMSASRKAGIYRSIAELRRSIKADQDTIAGFAGDTSTDAGSTGSEGADADPDLQAQLDQQRIKAEVAQKAASIATAALGVFQGSADIGYGRANVIIQTLHPGDSRTLRAVAEAATAGFGVQGANRSSQVVTAV